MINLLVSLLLSLGNVGAFAILAVGIVMIYRASKVLNLAHGAMVMFPPYVVLIMTGKTLTTTGAAGPSVQRILACLLPAAAVGAALVTVIARSRLTSFNLRLGSRTIRIVFGRAFRTILALVGTLAGLVFFVNLAGSHGTIIPFVIPAGIGVSLPIAVAIGLISAGALGYVVERVFVRTLRAQGPTAQTVGTVAALGIVVALAAKVFGTGAENAVAIFPQGGIDLSYSTIRWGEIGLFMLAMLLTGLLILLLQMTDLGLVMRGTAENRRAASLMGINADRTTSLTWVLGGLMAGLSGIMLASVTNLNPYVLSLQALPAFVAALLGGMASLTGAVAGAAIVGATFSVVSGYGPLQTVQGAPQLILAVAAVVAMATKGQKIVAGDVRSESVAAAGKTAGARGLGPLSQVKRPLGLLGVGIFVAFPFLPFVQDSLIGNANKGARYTLIAISLVILIGWVGQISLGHAALVGVGAYVTGWLAEGFGIPFPFNVPIAASIGAGVAVLLGLVAVRVRGLFLAVATLIFSWMGSEFLFRQDWFIKHSSVGATTIGQGAGFPSFDLSSERTFYFLGWAIAAIALLAAANLRDSKTGRAFFALQGSEMAAASLGIDVTRYKVMAFAVSGFLAGAAGSLLLTHDGNITPDGFGFNFSLLFVAVAVVGGLRSLGGAVTAGLLFAMLDELQLRVKWHGQPILNGYLEVFSAGLLAVVLLTYPGGLAGLGNKIAHALGNRKRAMRALAKIDRALDVFLADFAWARLRLAARVRERLEAPVLDVLPTLATSAGPLVLPETPLLDVGGVSVSDLPAETREQAPLSTERETRPLLVRADHVTVRFGGLTAVNDVTLDVREGEIVGLIGPNGAGKTVTFNSIAGLVTPTEGTITLYGDDVTHAPVHERARLGIARTFQVLQLFPALSIFDNLLVATHLHNDTGLLSHVSAANSAVDAERAARARVQEVVELLGLRDVVDKYPGDLPFGTLRTIEVARALVTDLKFIMLDEAFSGLDDTETEALVQSLLKVRALGVTLLLIEHDVKLVMSVSDYVYVLDRGTLIAEGIPAHVQRDPAVIAAYIGKPPEDVEAQADEEALV